MPSQKSNSRKYFTASRSWQKCKIDYFVRKHALNNKLTLKSSNSIFISSWIVTNGFLPVFISSVLTMQVTLLVTKGMSCIKIFNFFLDFKVMVTPRYTRFSYISNPILNKLQYMFNGMLSMLNVNGSGRKTRKSRVLVIFRLPF